MKTLQYIGQSILVLALTVGCEQENIELQQPETPTPAPACPTGASAGSADFTKFVAIGSSFSSGFQAGALFNEGQTNSLPKILAKQFECVGGPATFNQPTIGSENGFNIFVTPNPVVTGAGPADFVVLGRFKLQGTPPQPSPIITPADVASLPDPTKNTGFLYTGDSEDLNNFSVQALFTGQALIPETGTWTLAGLDPRFNPFYARFASDGGAGTTTLLEDMKASLANGGTFFSCWLGMDDFLLYAVNGGDENKAPITDLDGMEGFTAAYGFLISQILGVDDDLKGVLINFPNIFTMPHFTSVPYNAIPLDATTAGGLNATLAANYNAFLEEMVTNMIITEDEKNIRMLSFNAGQNGILLTDETLTDLSAFMVGPAAGLINYAQARQAKSTDIIPLSTGAILGEAKDDNPLTVWGVSYPVEDSHVLIPSEITEINQRRTDFNTVIQTTVETYPTKLALADVNKALSDFITAQVYVMNGVTITPNINPPTGIYSEDGVHPNSRGYAFLGGVIIDAINTKFGASIPKPNLALYKATGLPINP